MTRPAPAGDFEQHARALQATMVMAPDASLAAIHPVFRSSQTILPLAQSREVAMSYSAIRTSVTSALSFICVVAAGPALADCHLAPLKTYKDCAPSVSEMVVTKSSDSASQGKRGSRELGTARRTNSQFEIQMGTSDLQNAESIRPGKGANGSNLKAPASDPRGSTQGKWKSIQGGGLRIHE
jgi:hypothetical protein